MFNISEFRSKRHLEKLDKQRGLHLAAAINSAIEDGDMTAIDAALDQQVGMNDDGMPHVFESSVLSTKRYAAMQYAEIRKDELVANHAVNDQGGGLISQQQSVNYQMVDKHLQARARNGQFPQWRDALLVRDFEDFLEVARRDRFDGAERDKSLIQELVQILDGGSAAAIWRSNLDVHYISSRYLSKEVNRAMYVNVIMNKPTDASEYASEVVAPLVNITPPAREPSPKSMSM